MAQGDAGVKGCGRMAQGVRSSGSEGCGSLAPKVQVGAEGSRGLRR